MKDKARVTYRNIGQPDAWWEAAENQAKLEELPLAEWLGKLILKALPREVRTQLPKRPKRGRPWE